MAISMSPSGAISTTELSAYLKAVAVNGGCSGRIACRDVDLAMKLKKNGVSVDPRSSVAWASTIDQACKFRDEHKFVICSNPDFLEVGACLAIFREHGKPVFILNLKNYKASGIQLPDTLMKLVKIS
jgi:hypothetical protein